ncbi:MAG: hypothetical protein V3U78_08350 [Thiotrichaceae bacterium]
MKTFIAISLSIISLAGCHSSNNNGGSDPGAQLKALASQAADNEPSALGDATTLKNDINALFNGADTDPIEVNEGDSLQDVISRASGS